MDQNFTNNYFTNSISEDYPLKDFQYHRQSTADTGSELYEFLFGDAEYQTKTRSLEQANFEYSDIHRPKKQKDKPSNILKQTTGRLDFRSSDSYVSDSQMRAMSSKERRQLRNKISARNFRNRRKEYLSTLEEEMSQQKAENQKLKSELQEALDTIAKLRKENDKLRLNAILGEPVIPSESQITMENLPSSIRSQTPINNTTAISVCSNNNFSSNSSSNGSILLSPPTLLIESSNEWNFVLSNFNNTTVNNHPNTYLSHALLPMWNFNQILSKGQTGTKIFPSEGSQLFYQYPLLAPALMSVVLNHTMTMSTEELNSNSRLLPNINQNNNIRYNDNNPFETSANITDKKAKAIWDILEPLTLLKERNERINNTNTNRESAVATQPHYTENIDDLYLPWFQRYMYRYLFDYVTTGTIANPTRKRKFILCVKFQQARSYITA